MQVSTLRPGLLVSLKTSTHGNISYKVSEIEPDHLADDGARWATWQTDRVIELPAEHEEAQKARSKARSLINSVCSPSSFGLLCPEADREKLTTVMAEAREIVAEFNSRATITRIALFVIVGRVAADDVEAIRAINSEVSDLLTTMEAGLQRLDVETVREAANKARAISAMLSPAAAERAQKAIEVARSAARRIVKAGEAAAVEIDEATLNAIRSSRTAFLDLDKQAEVQIPAVTGRAIDLMTIPELPMSARPPGIPAVEWEY